ncbi:MAG: DUF4416 family protein [Deltaproteobacteria bacterium]|nr:MAG: DUF4416 family protein [Deltaproteobacteria bacterium]
MFSSHKKLLLRPKLRDNPFMPITAVYPPTDGLLFFALLYRSDLKTHDELKREIQKDWGDISDEFNPSHFPMKEYYAKEMGTPLERSFLVIKGKFPRETLIQAKTWSMIKEEKYLIDGGRSINIDPGLICLEQMLLISTKPYSHRIYLSDNLYAELTYQFSAGQFQPLPWTYPDYVHDEARAFFTRSRQNLK